MLTQQTSNHGNESARITFVTAKIKAVLEQKAGANFLDLGAGLSPFKGVVERLGGSTYLRIFRFTFQIVENWGYRTTIGFIPGMTLSVT